MSIMSGQSTFDKLSERTNRYQAVAIIAREAQRRAEQYNNLISHSEALSWVLTGDKPKKLLDIENFQDSDAAQQRIKAIMYEILLSVDDSKVSSAAEESVKASLDAKNLVYIYKGIQAEPKKARVRVLTRMIWRKISEIFLI